MPSAFTHYWSESTLVSIKESELFDHTAGSRFHSSGVTVGDRVFGLSQQKGVPILVGRMTLSHPIVDFNEAKRLLKFDPWEAEQHLIGDRSTATLQTKRPIPPSVLRELRFESPSGATALKFVSETQLDRQTLRGFRRLTPASAEMLEALLENYSKPTFPYVDEMFPDEISRLDGRLEGARKQVMVNAFERDPVARSGCACRLYRPLQMLLRGLWI